jgi:hypothetical protein
MSILIEERSLLLSPAGRLSIKTGVAAVAIILGHTKIHVTSKGGHADSP